MARILECPAKGDRLNATELIGEAASQGASIVAIPAERFSDDFFRLKTGVAGDFIQKFVTYRVRLVVIGDISRHLEESGALRDFVYEANRGEHLWFLADRAELEARLEARSKVVE